ncbi:unnamed protein product [Mycena citricolor]|uniref:Uncharacterized protein n=1 Tax=Mycena citricolor TaxID=2018698 RepID=A0AAD2GTM5_9AGAR|nr:unnamed protein product [Mycena citricolor]
MKDVAAKLLLTPIAPPSALPTVITHAPGPNAEGMLITPSSKRSMTGQTAALLNAAAAAPAAAVPATQPPTPTATPAPASTPGSAAALAPALSPLKAAASKTESGAAGVRRLDGNISAVAARVEEVAASVGDDLRALKGDLAIMRTGYHEAIADAVAAAAASLGAAAFNPASCPVLAQLIDANNNTVEAVEGLRSQLGPLASQVEKVVTSVAVLVAAPPAALEQGAKRAAPSDGFTNDGISLPVVKKIAIRSSTVSLPVAPPPAPYNHHVLPTAPAAMLMAAPAPAAAPAAHSPAAPTPAVMHAPAVHVPAGVVPVVIGDLKWGRDISGQVRSLLRLAPYATTIAADGIKGLQAQRCPANKSQVLVTFPHNLHAAQAVNAWAAAPAPTFEAVTVAFQGAAPALPGN